MKTNNLWSVKADCCGCELCSQACPQSTITMQQDEEGFLYPYVNEEGCIGCNRCIKVCPMKTMGRESVPIIKGYGGYANNTEDVKISASGGYSTVVSRSFIQKKKGVVYGVRYSVNFEDVYFSRVENEDEVEQFRTSKYVQAKKGDVYKHVLADLKQSRNVLFVGLPCEVSALYHYVGNNSAHLYTASLICHGPSSIRVHQEFCSLLRKKYSSDLKVFSLRYKMKGWKPYYIHAEFKNGKEYNTEFSISDYGIAFQYLKRPSCSSCNYKYGNNSFGLVSDLTFGDFHAVPRKSKMYNRWGVSEAIVHTRKGQELMELVINRVYAEELPIKLMTTGNRAFYEALPQKPHRELFVTLLNKQSLNAACNDFRIKFPQLRKYYKTKLVKLVRMFIR